MIENEQLRQAVDRLGKMVQELQGRLEQQDGKQLA